MKGMKLFISVSLVIVALLLVGAFRPNKFFVADNNTSLEELSLGRKLQQLKVDNEILSISKPRDFDVVNTYTSGEDIYLLSKAGGVIHFNITSKKYKYAELPNQYKTKFIYGMNCEGSECTFFTERKSFKGLFPDSSLFKFDIRQNEITTLNFSKLKNQLLEEYGDTLYNVSSSLHLGNSNNTVVFNLKKAFQDINDSLLRKNVNQYPRLATLNMQSGKVDLLNFPFPLTLKDDLLYHNMFIDAEFIISSNNLLTSYTFYDSILLHRAPYSSSKVLKVNANTILAAKNGEALDTDQKIKTIFPDFSQTYYWKLIAGENPNIVYRLARVPASKLTSDFKETNERTKKVVFVLIKINLKERAIVETILPDGLNTGAVNIINDDIYVSPLNQQTDSTYVFQKVTYDGKVQSEQKYISYFNRICDIKNGTAIYNVKEEVLSALKKHKHVYAINYNLSCGGCITKTLDNLTRIQETGSKETYKVFLTHRHKTPKEILKDENAQTISPHIQFIHLDKAKDYFDSFYPLRFSYQPNSNTYSVDTLDIDFVY